MSHSNGRARWFGSSPLMRLIKEYIDEGDERQTGPRGPQGEPGPPGPPGPPAPPLPPVDDVPLPVETPATSTGLFLATNPDGSRSLIGNVNYPGPAQAGDPFIFTHLPAGLGPARAMSFPATAWLTTTRTYVPVVIDLNPNSTAPSAVFVRPPSLIDGEELSFNIDHVTYWAPPAA